MPVLKDIAEKGSELRYTVRIASVEQFIKGRGKRAVAVILGQQKGTFPLDSGAVPFTISKPALFIQIAEHELDHVHRKGLFILSPAVHKLAP